MLTPTSCNVRSDLYANDTIIFERTDLRDLVYSLNPGAVIANEANTTYYIISQLQHNYRHIHHSRKTSVINAIHRKHQNTRAAPNGQQSRFKNTDILVTCLSKAFVLFINLL